MQYPVFFFVFLAFMSGNYKTNNHPESRSVDENSNCSKGLMRSAWYEKFSKKPLPPAKDPGKGFIILVDPAYKAGNYITGYEESLRAQSIHLDTTNLFFHVSYDILEKLSTEEKLDTIAKIRSRLIREADTIHIESRSLNVIRIINNSSDTIALQTQDGSYICVMQALNKNGEWLPIQYWNWSRCGNSYYRAWFMPDAKSAFIARIPNRGNYKTRLRLKMLGKDKFCYSNEFMGKIDYCEFVEDSATTGYKLDTLYDFGKCRSYTIEAK